MVVFISDYFQENLKAKPFKKSKKHYFGAILGIFSPQIRTKMNFPGKKGSVSFEILQLFTIVQKSQKKLMSHSWEKCRNDSRTDRRWTDRQTDSSDFIGPSVKRGSNKGTKKFKYKPSLLVTPNKNNLHQIRH